jgi:hypothetical protein
MILLCSFCNSRCSLLDFSVMPGDSTGLLFSLSWWFLSFLEDDR